METEKIFQIGCQRSMTPSESLEKILPLMPQMGITRLANVTGLDRIGVPVFNGIRPNSRSLSVSQGKGFTHDSAKMSALMETIEYYHAEHVHLPLRHDSASSLARDSSIIDIDKLALRLGARLYVHKPYYWVQGKDLFTNAAMYTPFETVTLNKVGLDYSATTFRLNSNGLASGNNQIEAILHGIFELVERDAMTMWWINERLPITSSKIDPDSIQDPSCLEVIEKIQNAEVLIALWKITSDIGIPTFQCCLIDSESYMKHGKAIGACWGWGCHLSPSIALMRAMTEAVQSRITVITASRDDNFKDQYKVHHNTERTKQIRNSFFQNQSQVDMSTIEDESGEYFEADLSLTLKKLQRVGIDSAVMVDLSKQTLEIPVIKMVIPQLEHSILFPDYKPGERAMLKKHQKN